MSGYSRPRRPYARKGRGGERGDSRMVKRDRQFRALESDVFFEMHGWANREDLPADVHGWSEEDERGSYGD